MKLCWVNGRDTIVYLPFFPNGLRWGSFIHAPEDSRFPKGNFEYRFVVPLCHKTVRDVPEEKRHHAGAV